MTNAALRAEEARDLRSQIADLDNDASEIQFMDTSPRRVVDTVYSVESGEPINVLRYHLTEIMAKKLPDGRPAFTARPENAPVYKQGHVKCFMAKDSPAQEALHAIGIYKVCPAERLANDYAMQVHAEHKHRTEWRMYMAHLEGEERQADRARQQAQIDAMMAVAAAATGEKRGPGRPRKEHVDEAAG